MARCEFRLAEGDGAQSEHALAWRLGLAAITPDLIFGSGVRRCLPLHIARINPLDLGISRPLLPFHLVEGLDFGIAENTLHTHGFLGGSAAFGSMSNR